MGLGVTGFNPPVAERMIREAGFVDFVTHDFQDPANLYYEAMKPGGSSGLRPSATSAQDSHLDLSAEPAPAMC